MTETHRGFGRQRQKQGERALSSAISFFKFQQQPSKTMPKPGPGSQAESPTWVIGLNYTQYVRNQTRAGDQT